MPRRPSLLPLLLGAALAAGCAPTGQFVWADGLKPVPRPGPADVLIAPGDVLRVRVAGQDSLSTGALVRADGRITLPLIGEQVAEGITPATLTQLLEAQYLTFLKTPVVAVAIEQHHAEQVSVLGRVAAPGTFPLRPGTDVLQGLALAGGLTPFAQRDRIFVLRREVPGRPPIRIRFRYEWLTAADWRAISFELRGGDVVLVE